MVDATNAENAPTFYSALGDDPELRELVTIFVDEIPDRVNLLVGCLASGDWDGLGRLAHQFKSAVGSYGFGQLVLPAGRLETAVREGHAEDLVEEALATLTELCNCVRAGSPANQSENSTYTTGGQD